MERKWDGEDTFVMGRKTLSVGWGSNWWY